MADDKELKEKLHEGLNRILKVFEWREEPGEPSGEAEEPKDKVRTKKRAWFLHLAVVALAVVLLILLVITLIGRIHYDSYEVVTSSVVEKTDNVSTYRSIDDEILRFSSDGASLLKKNLDSVWNVTYDMEEPEADWCSGAIVIYDRGGTDVRVFDRKGLIGAYQADRPIIKARVSKDGNVMALLSDNEAALLRYYTSDGAEIASISSTMQTTGYPADFDLSENGLYLAVSYMAVRGDSVGTTLTFYDFSSEGRAIADNVTAEARFDSEIAPVVRYEGNDRVTVIRENGFTLFRGKTPAAFKSVDFDQEIISTFYNEDRIGFIFMNEDGDARYDMKIYDRSGRLRVTAPVDMLYDDVTVSRGQIILTSRSELGVYTMGGACRFAGHLEEGDIASVLRTGNHRYLVVTNSRTEMIKLT